MKKIRLVLPLFFIASFAFVGCDDDDSPENNYMMDNQEFVNMATSSNNFEIQAGQQAMEKGQREDIKTFGEHMVHDHGQAAEEMIALAADQNFTMPTVLAEKEQALLDQLTPLSGEDFDNAFVEIMVQSHQDAVTLFENASGEQGVSNVKLREFADNKLPVLKSHLEEAKALNLLVNP